MQKISRYIIREHLAPFFFALAVIMFVFITKFIVQYIGRLFGKGLAFSTILEFVYLNLAWMLALAVPMAVLVASLMAFGRLSADNEITILKSSGINLYRIIRPALIWGIILTLLMIYYNDRVLPEFNHQARLLARSISQKKPTFNLEEGIYLKLDNFNILVEEVEQPLHSKIIDDSDILSPNYQNTPADRLNRITIFDYSNPQMQRTVIADYGYLVFDQQREQLVFNLFDGAIHEINTRNYSEYRQVQFSKHGFNIPASNQVFKRVESSQRGDREMNIQMMRDEVATYRQKKQQADSLIIADIQRFLPHPDSLARRLAAVSDTAANDDEMARRSAAARSFRKLQSISQKLQSQLNNRQYFERQIYKYEVEIHKKYSIPFACIVFVLIGGPLGIRAKKGSLGVGVSFSLGFFLLYWACLIGGEELADHQMVSPFLAMWFPNLIVGAFGIYITYRTVKETHFIQWERMPKFLQQFFKSGA